MDRSDHAAVVLAAGQGTRLRSPLAKVLHRAAGRTVLRHVLEALRGVGFGQVVVVVGHQADEVTAEAEAAAIPGLCTALQPEQHGTGHAAACGLAALNDGIDRVVVVNGDAPLLRTATVTGLLDAGADADAAILTVTVDDPHGYGRVLRDDGGAVLGVVEERDATAEQRRIRETNAGMYLLDRDRLVDALDRLGTDNAQGERYLTDVVAIVAGDGGTVETHDAPFDEVAGVNDRAQLAAAAAVLRARHLDHLARDVGVTVVDPATTYVDLDVAVGTDATLLPGTHLQGTTRIGAAAVVGPDCRLVDTDVGEGAEVTYTVALGASIGPHTTVGPFTYLRPGARLERGAKAGAYVEVKGSTIGEDSKVSHLTYIGDTSIGRGANVGAGTVTVNYDGYAKHRTDIGDGAFVGSGSMLVAPVRVGDGAITAAGSAITEDVPDDALAIGRARQVTKPGWAAARRDRLGG